MANGINWSDVFVYINEAKNHFAKEGVNPTLRTIFYYLVSKEVIPNTINYYKSLSRQIVKAKKEGKLSWDFLEDHVRYSLEKKADRYIQSDMVDDTKYRCDDYLKSLNIISLIDEYFNWVIPAKNPERWAKQSIIPEIWIEKDALAHTIEKWLKNDKYFGGITIRVNKGYASWGFIRDSVRSMKSTLSNNHNKIMILYLGDLDPSGMDIQRAIKESFEHFDMDSSQVDMKRIALTSSQVEQYNLPPRPEDAETIAKLNRDSRMKNYEQEYICELDSLVAYVPSEFKRLIKDELMKYYDESVYSIIKAKHRKIYDECLDYINETKEKARKKIIDQIRNENNGS